MIPARLRVGPPRPRAISSLALVRPAAVDHHSPTAARRLRPCLGQHAPRGRPLGERRLRRPGPASFCGASRRWCDFKSRRLRLGRACGTRQISARSRRGLGAIWAARLLVRLSRVVGRHRLHRLGHALVVAAHLQHARLRERADMSAVIPAEISMAARPWPSRWPSLAAPARCTRSTTSARGRAPSAPRLPPRRTCGGDAMRPGWRRGRGVGQ